MVNLLSANAWDITTDIFSIIGVVFSIFLSIILPLYGYIINKVTTKTFNATFNAVLSPKPSVLQNTNAVIYSCNVTCLNKTNKDVSIIKADILCRDKVVNILSISPNNSFTVKAKSAYSYPFRLAILPNMFQLSSEFKLRLYTSDKMLDYYISFPYKEEIG